VVDFLQETNTLAYCVINDDKGKLMWHRLIKPVPAGVS